MDKKVTQFKDFLLAGAGDHRQEVEPIWNVATENMEVYPMAALRLLYDIEIGESEITFPQPDKVVVRVTGRRGDRGEQAIAATDLVGLNGEQWGFAVRACETSAKTRLTSSLLGYGFSGSKDENAGTPTGTTVVHNHVNVTTAPDPTPLEVPAVNNAKADVVEDPRPVVNGQPVKVVDAIRGYIELATTEVPQVTETTIAKMHQEAQALSAPTPNPAEAPVAKPAAPAAPVMGGFFDDEPALNPAPAVPGVTSPNPIASAIPSTTAVAEETKLSAPSTTSITPAGPVAATGQTSAQVPTPSTESLEPVPVNDIEVKPIVSDKPNRLQYQGYTTRCTKLVRDVLTKAGKDAPGKLLPYLRQRFQVQALENAPILMWEEALGQLESAKSPTELLKIISGK